MFWRASSCLLHESGATLLAAVQQVKGRVRSEVLAAACSEVCHTVFAVDFHVLSGVPHFKMDMIGK